ncbi:MAG TPA: glycoside hydrolase family 2 TIM barrel-domain containing protein, partial [Phototrophicaceae bacterium]|nr:glycoside hydrolase family 2 TIM barrel-domain containing protein [Phototrophicaceae bacterium]
MRQILSLAGAWQFQPDPDNQLSVHNLTLSRSIPVPLPWQAAFADMQMYSGYAWYQRDFELDAAWLSGEILLNFGAVDYWCEVFVNGIKAGEHEGGYTPFSFPIRDLLHEGGSNRLTVRVFDPVQDGSFQQRHPVFPLEPATHQPPFGAVDVPHGKQDWYINVGGIWQAVTLNAVPKTWLQAIKATSAINGNVEVKVEIAGAALEKWGFEATILYDGRVVAQINQLVNDSNASWQSVTSLKVESPHLWSPDHPALYELRIKMGDDELTTRFGFREISTRKGKLYLNDEPLYLLAALDQDFYLDTIYTPPSEAYLRNQFQKVKELGLNCLRCHIKVPDPLYLDLADEMGLLIWAEIPSWRTFYPKGTYHPDQLLIDEALQTRVETILRAMIDRDYNHPALVIWSIVNEDWGTALLLSAADRAWVQYLYTLCKQLDTTRLVVDNSACPNSWGPNVHVQTDLEDFHLYYNIPDAAGGFVRSIEQFDMRALWTYSPFGDIVRSGDEPLILSEFGNWGLAGVQQYLDQDGSEPGWFNLGPWWGGWDGEPGWMKGVLGRFRGYGLDAIFGDFASFAMTTQWHEYQALKFQIEVMRRFPNIVGYVITELADIYWEGNGLLDFARNPKAFHKVFGQVNAEDVIVPQLPRYAYWDDEVVPLLPHVSHFSRQNWHNTRLQVQLNDKRDEQTLDGLAPGNVNTLPIQNWQLPSVSQAELKAFELKVENGQGAIIARNDAKVLVLPAETRRAAFAGTLAVIESSDVFGLTQSGFEKAVKSTGYHTVTTLNPGIKTAVTTTPTPELLNWVRAGGALLFLYSGVSPFFWAQSRGGAYSGNWMTCWT